MAVGIWMIVGGVCGALTGWVAVSRNHPVLPWWLLGCVIGPLALPVLLSRPSRHNEPPAVL